MCRSMVLYTVSLLSRDSCERVFISQLTFLSLNSSWHPLALCVFHVSFSSRWSPRHFTSFLTGMWVLWRFTGARMSRRVVNVTCAGLDLRETFLKEKSDTYWRVHTLVSWYFDLRRKSHSLPGTCEQLIQFTLPHTFFCRGGGGGQWLVYFLTHILLKTNKSTECVGTLRHTKIKLCKRYRLFSRPPN